MRKCDNCEYGHYNNDELMCGYNEFLEEKTDANSVCVHHEFINGYSNESNYLLYDEKYIAPGFIIGHKENNRLVSFIKFYTVNSVGFPCFAMRVFDENLHDKEEMTFNEIKFSFRSMEDADDGLYEVFYKLALDLKSREVKNIDSVNGNNKFSVEVNDNVVTLCVRRDVHGILSPSEYTEILIGDDMTCDVYIILMNFYKNLMSLLIKKANEDVIKELRNVKIKKYNR